MRGVVAIHDVSEIIDSFYVKHGPCCAGCDWWQYANSVAGQCIRHAPVAASERLSMTGISNISAPIGAGHPVTERDHYCGDFKDEFDWLSLPLPYLRRIGKTVTVTPAVPPSPRPEGLHTSTSFLGLTTP